MKKLFYTIIYASFFAATITGQSLQTEWTSKYIPEIKTTGQMLLQ